MPEIITLNAPIKVDAGASVFRVSLFSMDVKNSVLKIHLGEWAGGAFVEGGKHIPTGYSGAEARTLMRQLNKANLSTQSLHQRVMAKLLADGKIPAGVESGAPE